MKTPTNSEPSVWFLSSSHSCVLGDDGVLMWSSFSAALFIFKYPIKRYFEGTFAPESLLINHFFNLKAFDRYAFGGNEIKRFERISKLYTFIVDWSKRTRAVDRRQSSLKGLQILSNRYTESFHGLLLEIELSSSRRKKSIINFIGNPKSAK